ncbi:XrtA/PEP-CTERM system histidine kinase PrsK [Janthinobacterium sp.]|uniref:XrtA/PEP-CTERM system histidine kinase PrsK n=1 Tax=Janthinobacterium sp. TaxID=1871054 RepID=UPI00293D958E|nr:XrtA/PEP-CTERM system histidine kinase PrsK [Janthinobacterium sp.]
MTPGALSGGDVAALSYGLASLCFLLLSMLLLGNWRARRNARALAGACLLTALWAAGTVALELWAHPLSWYGALLEVLRSGAWLVFVLLLLEPAGLRLNACLLAIAALAAAQLLAGALAAPLASAALLAVLFSRLFLAVLGMLLVEQWYRNTPAPQRWGIKFACLGIGALFVYDFYLYSDALLFRAVSPEIWTARGIVNALAAPLIALSAARNPAWKLGLALSRQMMFRSAALLGSAIYLLAMASSAYYLRYFGGAWGPVMQVAYLGGAGLLLAGVLFSGALRSKLKVFISKHFYTASFDYREEWLRFTRALSGDGPGLGERTIQAVAQLVESPAGALWIRREQDRCEPAASWNMPAQTAVESASSAFCRHLETKQWVIDVPEWLARPNGMPMPDWVLALPQLWLVVPLMLHGRLFGFVALAHPRTPMSLDWEVLDVLKIAGSQAAGYLAHRESADSLLVARQFESFNRMSTFIVHDLKNLVFQLSLLLSNAEKHRANPDFQRDMLGTLDYSVNKMTLLLHKLSRGQSQDVAAPLQLDQLLAQAVSARAGSEPAPVLEVAQGGLTVLANWGRLERVLGHIIQNAIEATAKDGRVLVRLLRERDSAVVELCDNGLGMSEQFIRERLFKPFESTKAAGMGIGVFESREYIREVGGQLEVSSEPAQGTTFRVILPLHGEGATPA